ncbi:MAG: amidase domain-containing protein [Candidatus Saccharibacteria bacterium]
MNNYEVPPDSSPVIEQSLSQRLLHRFGLPLALATTAIGGVEFADAAPIHADSGIVYTVENTGDGVYARNSPHENDTQRISGLGAYDGDSVELVCGVTSGDPIGKYNNHTWHKVIDLSRSSEGQFWINDHWLTTPGVANQLAPGEANCDATTSQNLQPAQTVKPFVEFDRNAARDWAINHAEDTPPQGVDACTWFSSEDLAAGGLPQDNTWNLSFQHPKLDLDLRYGTDTAWIAPKLTEYLARLPYVDIVPLGHMNAGNNDLPQAKPGDIIAYTWNGTGKPADVESLGSVQHLSVVVGDSSSDPAYPVVAEWGRNSQTPYVDRGWTYSMKTHGWLQNEKGQHDMFAFLIHMRDENDV